MNGMVSELPPLADFVRQNEQQIVDAWATVVRAMPVASAMSQPRLIDHLPEMLRRIAEYVETVHTAARPTLNDLPKVHALDRLDVGFDLKQVSKEYAVLRDCVLVMYEHATGGVAHVDEVRRFNAALDEAVSEAVQSYARQRERILAGLDRISSSTLGTLPITEFLDRLLTVFTEATEAADSSTIMLLESDGKLYARASLGLQEEVTENFSLAIGEGFSGRIAAERRPLALRNASVDAEVKSPHVRERGIRAIYGVPLLLDDRLIGVAHMGSRTAFDFSDDDKLLFRALTSRATALIYESMLRERAERRAADELQWLKSILAKMPAGIVIIDSNDRIVMTNEELTRMWGEEITPGERLTPHRTNKTLRVNGSPVTVDELPAHRALRGEVVNGEELRFLRPDGSERILLVSATPLRDEDDQITAAVIAFGDITDQKRAQDARQFLLRAVDELNSSLDYGKTLAAVAGLAVPMLADWCAVDLVESDRIKRVAVTHVDPAKVALLDELKRIIPNVIRTGQPELRPDYLGVPLKVRGKTIGALSFAMAESGRRYTKENLELAQALADRAALSIENARLFHEVERGRLSAERNFRLMVESVKDYAIFMLDPNGVVTTWNRGAERIKGYRADEIIGQHFSRFYPDEAVRAGHCEHELELARHNGHFEEEGWRIRKDGSRFWADVTITPIVNGHGLRGYAKVTRDLTERRRAEQELTTEMSRRLAAEETAHFAQLFAGVLGHDLRNPLNAIMMAAQVLLRRDLGPAATRGLARIKNSADRMGRMISDLLDFTRGRLGGGIPIARTPIDLCATIREVVDELRIVNPGRTITLDTPDACQGEWDRDRIAQVVSNLVGNALYHGDRAQPVAVRLRIASTAFVLDVSNKGEPIPRETLPHVFDPFRRAVASREKSPNGLGLGLYIVKHIVDAHGGSVTVRSDDDVTTFTVSLPRT